MKYFQYELTIMNASELKSGQAYQRPISPKRIRQIREHFSWNLVNPIKVSDRGGVKYVFDGQHTLTVIKANFGDDTMVPVMRYTGLTYEKEAELAARSDENRRTMARHEIDNALTEAGDKEHTKFIEACGEFGWVAEFSNSITRKNYYVQNPSMVFREVYLKHGKLFLKQFLDIFEKSWGGDPDSMRAGIEKGIIKFMELFDGQYESKTLVKALSGVNTSIIDKNAKNDFTRRGVMRYAHTIWLMYNKVSKNKKLADVF